MKFHKKSEETGTEPVSFAEKETKIYRKGMRRGMLLSGILVLGAGLAACGINININGSSSESEISNLANKIWKSFSSGNSSSASSSENTSLSGGATISDVLDDEALSKIQNLMDALDTYYYEDVDTSTLQEGIYKGLVESTGDPYTEYYTAEEYQNLQNSTNGEYSGIGAGLTKDSDTGYPMISHIYDKSPAQDSGLQEGDIIYKVDDTKITSDMDTSDVAALIRGEDGTNVSVTVLRDGEEITANMCRSKIELTTVAYQMLDNKIGYIQIAEFSNNTESQFSDAVKDLEDQGMEKIIIDLRDNGGGVVDACAKIMDDVLPEGLTLYMEDKNGNKEEFTSDEENQINLPLVVLVNGNSASASEIFTAAIKDFEWGTIIGSKTYGKGVFQSVLPLDDGSAIKVTVGKFYSPKGNNYNGTGIEPDIELDYENTAGEDADYSMDTDNQLQKAIEVLNEK
jgi:carboxyl-terminal processing protease